MDNMTDTLENQAEDPLAAAKTVLNTESGLADGQVKCPKCGATDISLNTKKGTLRCNFCRFEFEAETVNEDTEEGIFGLTGEVIGSGSSDLNREAENIVTLKCQGCGAEVVIDTSDVTSARCHWCRNTLSINKQMDNGAVPDMILPFHTTKKEAQGLIDTYISKHKFFAHPVFTREFSSDNVMGVYLPYMVVDANTHVNFEGTGEVETRRYTVSVGKDQEETRYDADLYRLGREFDMAVDDLIVESSTERMDGSKSKTNNIINAILPFDTENCVPYEANYMKGYASERRDTDVSDLKPIVRAQIKDIARRQANEQSKKYDRGICWEKEDVEVKGQKWKSAYLPVWLYSYHQKDRNIMHYVAVNARTKETIGSIPINRMKLIIASVFVEILSILTWGLLTAAMIGDSSDSDAPSILFLIWAGGFLFYFIQYLRYRRSGERHYHEKETHAFIKNETGYDEFVEKRKKLRSSTYDKANNNRVEGTIINSQEQGELFKKVRGYAEQAVENQKAGEAIR